MSNPEAPKDDTMQEQTVQDEPTEQLDTDNPTRAIQVDDQQEPAADESGSDQPGWPPAVPDRPTGPHAPAIVLGLVCLAIATIVLAQEVGSLSVDWGDVGPLGIVAAGALLVLFGLVGLLTSRRNTKEQ